MKSSQEINTYLIIDPMFFPFPLSGIRGDGRELKDALLPFQEITENEMTLQQLKVAQKPGQRTIMWIKDSTLRVKSIWSVYIHN